MSEHNSGNNAGSSLDEALNAAQKVKGAVKTGKAIAQVLKGAATGGLHGAVAGAVRGFGKQFVIIACVLIMLPVLFLLMLPQLIFGGLNQTPPGGQPILNDNDAIVENISQTNSTIAQILTEGYEETKSEVESLAAGIEYVEIVDTVGGNIVFDANQIICWYSASQNQSAENISVSHLASLVSAHKRQLYYYETTYEQREVEKTDADGDTYTETVTFTIFTILYAGDDYFPNDLFALTAEQITLSADYAVNLTIFLYDSYEAAGNNTHAYIAELLAGDTTPLEDGVFGNPFPGQDWSGNITSYFGNRPYPGVGSGTSNHTGLDISNPAGTGIHAVMGGTVLFVRDSGNAGYGKHLAINHGGGYVTMYAHCSSISVSAGQRVEKGDEIAAVGKSGWSTGNHLHIEVIINGSPVDPLGYISNG